MLRMRGRCSPHDIRLVSLLDRRLYEARLLDEEREVLASRAIPDRHSPFFRAILSTVQVRKQLSVIVTMYTKSHPQTGSVGEGYAHSIYVDLSFR